ncbi:GL22968 [Drosophila persimilis]|uniref:GL22968 n=1 Tax=Drosophila persimilis TaxID=7234 RepID=B4H9S0_DROPE|nr:GL22968 [Drosophila persimilis]
MPTSHGYYSDFCPKQIGQLRNRRDTGQYAGQIRSAFLERIMYNQLLVMVQEKKALSEYQNGYRKAKSKVNTIEAVTDIVFRAIEGT